MRPTITSAPDIASLGDTIFVATPDAASIAKALWIVPSAVTHAQNWTQRANTLEFDVAEGGLNIALPADENEAPVGYYMLFLVNADGTPSMAEWIRATPNTALDGDFNRDGVVDAADYTVWRNGLGTKYEPEDYDLWKSNYGTPNGSGSIADAAGVPEPTVAALIMIALLATCGIRRERRR